MLNRQSTVSSPAQYISQFYTAVYYLPGLLHSVINLGVEFAGLSHQGWKKPGFF